MPRQIELTSPGGFMATHSLSRRLVLSIALACSMRLPAPCFAQENPNTLTTEPAIEAADCPPFTTFPQLPMTIVSCNKANSVKVTLPLKPDAQGWSQQKSVEGVYEYREYRSPRAGQQEFMFDSLVQLASMAGFTVLYSARPSVITARSGQTWVLINVGDDSYNISVVRDSQVSCAPVNNAEEIAREMEAHDRVAIYGIQFSPENQIMEEKSSESLNAVFKYISQNPARPLVIESHKVSTKGTEEGDFEITRERANAVVDWLVAHGISAKLLQAKPFGRMQPLTGNDTPIKIQCNERIELSKARK
jgi:outer membrane protein OmpA-like peptidoglycan-associated protein